MSDLRVQHEGIEAIRERVGKYTMREASLQVLRNALEWADREEAPTYIAIKEWMVCAIDLQNIAALRRSTRERSEVRSVRASSSSAATRKYGVHLYPCQMTDEDIDNPTCTCGLSQALGGGGDE